MRRERGRGKKVKNVGLFFACGDVVDGFGDGGDEEDFGEHGVDAFAEKLKLINEMLQHEFSGLGARWMGKGQRCASQGVRKGRGSVGGGGQTPACHQGRSC